MPLTPKQVKDVCLANQGHRQCRYLAPDDQNWGKYNCLKRTAQKKVIDEEVHDTLLSLKQQGQDYKKQGLPVADNCQGYPLLRIIDQGYDVKKP
jgi:hypothetical protein